MVSRSLAVIGALVTVSAAGAPAQGVDQKRPEVQALEMQCGGQQRPDAQALEMQMQVQSIMQTRSPDAEAVGREWLKKISPNLMPMLDSLQRTSPEEYWMEIAQLTAQMTVVQNIAHYKDSARADVVARMFGLEENARAQQRAYRAAAESNRPA
ncbi:MAG TPA: hypothetical protein VG454_16545, partial [Gemmatimonadales bacterium]|nr:hypothetical protein [Gemmatimonadales bacterium]